MRDEVNHSLYIAGWHPGGPSKWAKGRYVYDVCCSRKCTLETWV